MKYTTLLLSGVPQKVKLVDLSYCLNRLFYADDEIGSFALRDLPSDGKKRQIALDFRSGFDAIAAQARLDSYHYKLPDGGEYTLCAKITWKEEFMRQQTSSPEPWREEGSEMGAEDPFPALALVPTVSDGAIYQANAKLDAQLELLKKQKLILRTERKLLKQKRKLKKEYASLCDNASDDQPTTSKRRRKSRSRSPATPGPQDLQISSSGPKDPIPKLKALMSVEESKSTNLKRIKSRQKESRSRSKDRSPESRNKNINDQSKWDAFDIHPMDRTSMSKRSVSDHRSKSPERSPRVRRSSRWDGKYTRSGSSKSRLPSNIKDRERESRSTRSRSRERLASYRSRSRERLASYRSRSRERPVSNRSRSRERLASYRSRSRERLASYRSRSRERLSSYRLRSRERLASYRSRSRERLTSYRSRSRERLASYRSRSRERLASYRSRSRERDPTREKNRPLAIMPKSPEIISSPRTRRVSLTITSQSKEPTMTKYISDANITIFVDVIPKKQVNGDKNKSDDDSNHGKITNPSPSNVLVSENTNTEAPDENKKNEIKKETSTIEEKATLSIELSAIKEEATSSKELGEIKEEPTTCKELSAIKKKATTSKDFNAIKEKTTLSKELSAIKEKATPSKELSVIKEKATPSKGLNAIKEKATPIKELSAIKEKVTKSKELNAIKEKATTSKELSVIKEKATTSKDLNAIKEKATSSKELSVIKEKTTTNKDLSAIKEKVTTSKELNAIKEKATPSKELSVIKEKATTSKELSAIKEKATSSKDLSAIKEKVTMSKELNAIKEKATPSKDLSAIKEKAITSKELKAIKEKATPSKELSATKEIGTLSKELSATKEKGTLSNILASKYTHTMMDSKTLNKNKIHKDHSANKEKATKSNVLVSKYAHTKVATETPVKNTIHKERSTNKAKTTPSNVEIDLSSEVMDNIEINTISEATDTFSDPVLSTISWECTEKKPLPEKNKYRNMNNSTITEVIDVDDEDSQTKIDVGKTAPNNLTITEETGIKDTKADNKNNLTVIEVIDVDNEDSQIKFDVEKTASNNLIVTEETEVKDTEADNKNNLTITEVIDVDNEDLQRKIKVEKTAFKNLPITEETVIKDTEADNKDIIIKDETKPFKANSKRVTKTAFIDITFDKDFCPVPARPQFVLVLKKLLKQMKNNIKTADKKGLREFPMNMFKCALRSMLRNLVAGKGYLGTSEIIKLFRAKYSQEEDNVLINQVIEDIKMGKYGKYTEAGQPEDKDDENDDVILIDNKCDVVIVLDSDDDADQISEKPNLDDVKPIKRELQSIQHVEAEPTLQRQDQCIIVKAERNDYPTTFVKDTSQINTSNNKIPEAQATGSNVSAAYLPVKGIDTEKANKTNSSGFVNCTEGPIENIKQEIEPEFTDAAVENLLDSLKDFDNLNDINDTEKETPQVTAITIMTSFSELISLKNEINQSSDKVGSVRTDIEANDIKIENDLFSNTLLKTKCVPGDKQFGHEISPNEGRDVRKRANDVRNNNCCNKVNQDIEVGKPNKSGPTVADGYVASTTNAKTVFRGDEEESIESISKYLDSICYF